MADKLQVIALMIALIVAGIIMTFNLIPYLGLGFGNINNFVTGIYIIVARIVGVLLIGIPIWVIINVIRE